LIESSVVGRSQVDDGERERNAVKRPRHHEEPPLQKDDSAKEVSIKRVEAFFEPSAVERSSVNVDERERNAIKRPRNEVNS